MLLDLRLVLNNCQLLHKRKAKQKVMSLPRISGVMNTISATSTSILQEIFAFSICFWIMELGLFWLLGLLVLVVLRVSLVIIRLSNEANTIRAGASALLVLSVFRIPLMPLQLRGFSVPLELLVLVLLILLSLVLLPIR